MTLSERALVELLVRLDEEQWNGSWPEIEGWIATFIAEGGEEGPKALLASDAIHANGLASRVVFTALHHAYLADTLRPTSELLARLLERLARVRDDVATANGWSVVGMFAHDTSLDLLALESFLAPALTASLQTGRKHREDTLEVLQDWADRAPGGPLELIRSRESVDASLREVVELGDDHEREYLRWFTERLL